MADIVFPTDLVPQPEYPLPTTREDNVLRSNVDAGYELSRRRYTRQRKTWELKWTKLAPSFVKVLEDFYDNDTKSGSLNFKWTHPIDNKVYTVHFTEPINVSLTEVDRSDVSIKIRSV